MHIYTFCIPIHKFCFHISEMHTYAIVPIYDCLSFAALFFRFAELDVFQWNFWQPFFHIRSPPNGNNRVCFFCGRFMETYRTAKIATRFQGIFPEQSWLLAMSVEQTWMLGRLETPFVLLVWWLWRWLDDLLFNFCLYVMPASKH